MATPLGLDPSDVAFAWHVNDGRRGARQQAYEITVARMSVGGAGGGGRSTVWDSGRVASPDQAFVPYSGPGLASDAVYQWTVRTWDSMGRVSPRSRSTFETGLLDGDWKADWIWRSASTTAEPDQYTYVRKDVTLARSPIVRARAYVSGDQQYEMSINGAQVGKGQAYSFPDSQYYETLDVTDALHAGANAIGLLSTKRTTKKQPAELP